MGLDDKKNIMLDFLKKDKLDDKKDENECLDEQFKKAKNEEEEKLIELTKNTINTHKDVEEKMASILTIKTELKLAEEQRN